MGFFKDYKDDKSDLRDDFSQALDELIPGGDDFTEPDDDFGNDDMLVNTLDLEDVDTKSELSKLNGLLEQVTESSNSIHQNAAKSQRNLDRNFARDSKGADIRMTMEDRKRMNEEMMTAGSKQVSGVNPDAISDEVTVITEGTNIKGDIASDGSVDIRGRIVGNVTCNGKLVITGILEGNSNSSEFFADAAKVEGEVNSTGTVKIGIGSVVIGNITAASAVIAGAIKGDIDVKGPVILDASAIVMGNIKSKSVQINNGAVIEGLCSQCYAEVNPTSFFDNLK